MMREITAEQAFEHAACGDAVILDVRPQVVRHQGSVPGALVVEPGELTGRLRLNPAVRPDAEVAVVALNAQADEWRAAEIARARKRLAKGEDLDAVLEALSRVLTQKMLHGAMAELHSGDPAHREQTTQAISRLFLRSQGNNRH